MKYEDLPEVARPYKKKYYVRKRKDTFFPYRITRRRVEGKKNPQFVQEYIVIINPDGTLLEKKRRLSREKDSQERIYLEYGLSSFIYRKFLRKLQRSLFNSGGRNVECIIIAETVKYVLGTVLETAFESCRLSAASGDGKTFNGSGRKDRAANLTVFNIFNASTSVCLSSVPLTYNDSEVPKFHS